MGHDSDSSALRELDGLPLPADARVHRLDEELALIELRVPEGKAPDDLTLAEQDVALRLYDGDSQQQIAEARGVALKTISKQVQSIYRKLGVTSRAELVLLLRTPPDDLR